jgi:hypothetical protein
MERGYRPRVDVTRALEPIASEAAGRECTLVGNSGRGAAGKTTLARSSGGAQIVPTDPFWDGAHGAA